MRDDGSVVVGVLRINAASGAIINEIALEERRSRAPVGALYNRTPYFTDAYGDVASLGQNAPAAQSSRRVIHAAKRWVALW